MGANVFLDQLLKSGAGAWADVQVATDRARASGDFDKYAKGAAVGGLLGLLLGTRRGRALGGSVLKLGSVAAIGALAWKAYQDYQADQAGKSLQSSQSGEAAVAAAGAAGAAGAPAASPASTGAPALAAPARFEALPTPQLEQHSRAMLKAMIAAAKSDGHMDEREHQLVRTELARTAGDAETQAWVEAELDRPVDAAEVAAAAVTPEMAAEIYLATLLVVDETTTTERAYLDDLARQLRLAPGLKSGLEARALAARG
ncbi:MAG: tellurite resistance TerB family protein [Burkholderiales bacterium]|nr:tellurite resistance TerB family protein [Burkholderiales bacterium]